MQIVAIILSTVLVGLLAVLVPMEFEAEKADDSLDSDSKPIGFKQDEQERAVYKEEQVQLLNVMGERKQSSEAEVNTNKKNLRRMSRNTLKQRQVI